MINRILIAVLIAVLSFGSIKAQFNVGDWKIHSVFSEDQESVIDTNNGVFFVSDGNLYKYDKATAEITNYSKRNMLNDNVVSGIYYNYDGGYMVVVYSTSNIDIIDDDGNVFNFPDIADIQLTTTRGINDITFSGSDAYIATDFGYMVYDGDSRSFKESNVYYTEVKSAVKVGNYVCLNIGGSFYVAADNAHHSSLSEFTVAAESFSSGQYYPLSDNSFLFNGPQSLWLVTVSETGALNFSTLLNFVVDQFQAIPTGFIAKSVANGTLTILDKTASVTNTLTLSSDMTSSVYAANINDSNSVWVLNQSGLGKATINGTTLASAQEYAVPAVSSVGRVGYLYYNEALDNLYVMTRGNSVIYVSYGLQAKVNTLQNGVWTDITPENIPSTSEATFFRDIMAYAFDPDDAETYFVGTWFDGLYKVKKDSIVTHVNWNNSPMTHYASWCDIVPGVQFDADKNLWIIEFADPNVIAVLPRDKQSKSEITTEDWIEVNVSIPSGSDYRAQFLITKKSNLKVVFSGIFSSILMVFDDGGDPSSDNINSVSFESFSDQDGNTFDPIRHYCLFEDRNGMVWLGSSEGVVRFDPTEAFSSDFHVDRIKATSTDGSEDYLLAGQSVSCIAADSLGVMWMGTLNSGVYQVSADGTRILSHLTTSNSYLTSDKILSIACKPDGSAVYIGTETGLVEYIPDVVPGETDFSKVIVSPTNIAKDYSGFVTIEHLVSDCYVTITDNSGNVVANITADGGVAQWNLCNNNGDRVGTGKYLIYASTTAGTLGELIGSVNALR